MRFDRSGALNNLTTVLLARIIKWFVEDCVSWVLEWFWKFRVAIEDRELAHD